MEACSSECEDLEDANDASQRHSSHDSIPNQPSKTLNSTETRWEILACAPITFLSNLILLLKRQIRFRRLTSPVTECY